MTNKFAEPQDPPTPLIETTPQGDALTRWKKNVPLGRLGEPGEIARVASFLASGEAGQVNGVELLVDNGVAQI